MRFKIRMSPTEEEIFTEGEVLDLPGCCGQTHKCAKIMNFVKEDQCDQERGSKRRWYEISQTGAGAAYYRT